MPVAANDMLMRGIIASSRPVVSSGIVLTHSFSDFRDTGTAIPLTLGTHAANHFAFICATGEAGVTGFSITGATGYQTLFDTMESSSGRARRAAVFYKKLTSASEAPPTLTSADDDEISASIHVFSGVDTTNHFDVTYTTGGAKPHVVHGQNNYTFDIPEITTANANSCLIAFAMQTHTNISAWGTPSGFQVAEAIVAANEGGTHFNHAVAYMENAGVAGVKAATPWGNTGIVSISDWSSRIFALRAA
jgi:hypothetical protein